MSFASEVKKELCKVEQDNFCCKKAETYGLLIFAKNFTKTQISLTTENKNVLKKTSELVVETTGSIVDVISVLSHKRSSSRLNTMRVPSGYDRINILNLFGYSGNEVNLRINKSNFEDDNCVRSFLRGAFLSCGIITDPNCDYHIEFVVPYMNLAKDLCALILEIKQLDIKASIINRKGYFIIYIKESENIMDLLAYIGAQKAAMEVMQIKMVKEVRNYVNRTTNFETANIIKTAAASAVQIEAIKRIKDKKGLKWLPEDLREIAEIRLKNPDLSLREIGESLSTPMSRSGVNHRIKRIIDISCEI